MISDLKIPDGFQITKVAGSPLVVHPTMACFDDRGRLFVCENAGVNLTAQELEKQLPNSIRMLIDDDGDGIFDRHTIYADKMTFPMGAAWLDGSLYVASPPKIWKLTDTTGDGVADKREVLVDKFGYNGNAASTHGCFLGPEGRIYWVHGRHGHNLTLQDKEKSQKGGSYLMSCKPDGSDIQIHCGGGMDNPVEIDFTEEGEMIGTVNIMYSRPRKDCLVHWQYGGTYPHHETVTNELKRTGDLLDPIHSFGHVAISGTMRYRSDAFGLRYKGNFFATQFNTGKVVRLQLERKGSTFSVVQREFLSSKNRRFKPTDVLEDADGSLLVFDTGGWFYRGCPTSQMSQPDILGGVYRIQKVGVKPIDDPRGLSIDWSSISDTQILNHLDDSRFEVRNKAIRECAKRGDSIVPALDKLIGSDDGSELSQTGALWALSRMESEAASLALRNGLSSQRLLVVRTASRIVAMNQDPKAAGKLVELLQSNDPVTRREAAKGLGRMGNSNAVAPLMEAISRVSDRDEEHAFLYALIELNSPEKTRSGLLSKYAEVQKATLVVLDQLLDGKLKAESIKIFLSSEDEQLQKTALSLFSKNRNSWQAEAYETLKSWMASDLAWEKNSKIANELLLDFIDDDNVGELVGKKISDSGTSNAFRNSILNTISTGRRIKFHESWFEPLDSELKSSSTERIKLALAAVRAIDTNRFQRSLETIGRDSTRPTMLRIAAYESLSGRTGKLTEESFEFLFDLLVSEGSPNEQTRATQIIAASKLNSKQLVELATYLPDAGPMMLPELVRPFLYVRNDQVCDAFLEAMNESSGLVNVPMHQFSDIIKKYPKEYLARANGLLDKIIEHESKKYEKLDGLLPLLKTGNAKRGELVFFSEKSKCAICHRVGKKGGLIGPDLTTIGANRSARDLLESIVFPSASLVRQYEPYTIVTQKGRAYTGLIQRETKDALFIQQQTGEPIEVGRDEILKMSPSPTSIMPAGLEKELTPQDLADVIAWLKKQTKAGRMTVTLE